MTAAFAIVEKLAGIRRHRLDGLVAALRAGDGRLFDHEAFQRRTSASIISPRNESTAGKILSIFADERTSPGHRVRWDRVATGPANATTPDFVDLRQPVAFGRAGTKVTAETFSSEENHNTGWNSLERERNRAAFQKLLPDLITYHPGKYVVFHQQQPTEFFDAMGDAVRYGIAKFGNDNFSVHEVSYRNLAPER